MESKKSRDERREQIRLLLWSYYDAVQHGKRGDHAQSKLAKPGSRPPQRGHLWNRGSYDALEKALDSLRRYCNQSEGSKRHFKSLEKAFMDADIRKAEDALEMLLDRMPGNLVVPREVEDAWRGDRAA